MVKGLLNDVSIKNAKAAEKDIRLTAANQEERRRKMQA